VGLNEAVPLPELAFPPFSWPALIDHADRFAFASFRKKVIAAQRKLDP